MPTLACILIPFLPFIFLIDSVPRRATLVTERPLTFCSHSTSPYLEAFILSSPITMGNIYSSKSDRAGNLEPAGLVQLTPDWAPNTKLDNNNT